MKTFLRTTLLLLSLAGSLHTVAQTPQDFINPPHEARPRVWWHWMNGNISRDGIRKDILWMHRQGIAGFHVFDAGLNTPQVVPHRITYMTPEWKECLRYALHLADSLGMTVGIACSPGWSNTGGPWVRPEKAMKKLTWRTLRLEGGRKVDAQLPAPFTTTGRFQNTHTADLPQYACYKDIATVAVRLRDTDIDARALHPTLTASGGETPSIGALTDEDVETPCRIGADRDGQVWVQYSFDHPVGIRAISMGDGRTRSVWDAKPRPVEYRVEVSDDGQHFTHLTDIRQWGMYLNTVDLPPVEARHYRVVCLKPAKDPEGPYMNLTELVMHTESRINMSEEKTGFNSYGDLDQYPTRPTAEVSSPDDVVDISHCVDSEGRLRWDAPEGKWMIYRFGWSLTGKKNSPASPEATGLEVDKMDGEAVSEYIDHFLAMYDEATGGRLGKHGIEYLMVDSYEAGPQTWTPGMPQEFERLRGYSLTRWLPVLAGRILGSAERSERFLYDWRHTIGQLYEKNLYGTLADAAHRHGMRAYVESHENGRQLLADGMSAKAKGDIPMGAMWASSMDPIRETMTEKDMRESASTAHIYGRPIVSAEALTADGKNMLYAFHPGNLKPKADLIFASGVNRLIIHESAHQPVDNKRPGVALSLYGQWFNRHETWAEQARPWMDYIARSSYVLQQGRDVADIALFYGSDNSVTGRYGIFQPQVPSGYNYDFVNPEALTRLIGVEGTTVTTPGGARYRALVIDRSVYYLTLAELRAVARLARAGVIICGQRPTMRPSMGDDPTEWQRLVDEIWTPTRTNVSAPADARTALEAAGVSPDVESPLLDSLRWVHRRTADGKEIYWVCNKTARPLATTLSLRVSGLLPTLWNPEDGTQRPVNYLMEGGRTRVEVEMKPHDAFFLVFGDKTAATALVLPRTTETEVMTLDEDWTVSFQPGMGAPAETHLATLAPLDESEEPGIRYYSGLATYEKTFSLPRKMERGARYTLDLGHVGVLAEVTVNGHEVGTLWKVPYSTDITPWLKKKDNRIVVKVANLWRNRIIGDKQPGTKHRYAWCSWSRSLKADSPLTPSGLLGGVRIYKEK